MSTREIQDVTFKNGVFLFENGSKGEGMLIPRYNIKLAKIEYFFIPSSLIGEYEKAKTREHEAYRYYGNLVAENMIKQAAV